MPDWKKATPDVLKMAERLIEKHHKSLIGARIGFLFRDKAQKSKGKIILGKASKVSPRLQPYLNYDFLIWIAEEEWDNMLQAAREALLDHELCHCYMGVDGPKILPHDIEEFRDIIDRHGFWSTDLMLIKPVLQRRLPGIEEKPEARKGSVEAVDPDPQVVGELA